MRAIFNDLRDGSSSLDGAAVNNCRDLFSILDAARDRDPFVCELEGENGYKPTLGVSKENGFVQYSRGDGDCPYFVAVTRVISWGEERMDFLCGNTPSPISRLNILPIEHVKEIAAFFIDTGERSSEFIWEEI